MIEAKAAEQRKNDIENNKSTVVSTLQTKTDIPQNNEKEQKRKERVMLCGMITGILLLLGVGVYTLVFKLEFNFKEYLSGMDFSHADSSLLAFYSYIATLVLLLLGLDYWLRKKKFHS